MKIRFILITESWYMKLRPNMKNTVCNLRASLVVPYFDRFCCLLLSYRCFLGPYITTMFRCSIRDFMVILPVDNAQGRDVLGRRDLTLFDTKPFLITRLRIAAALLAYVLTMFALIQIGTIFSFLILLYKNVNSIFQLLIMRLSSLLAWRFHCRFCLFR